MGEMKVASIPIFILDYLSGGLLLRVLSATLL